MLLLAIEDVRKGRDPKHIKRDPAENKIVYIRATLPKSKTQFWKLYFKNYKMVGVKMAIL